MTLIVKTITISSCEDCPHHQYDYDSGDPKYWNKDVCWYGRDENLREPRILKNKADIIPKNCPLP